jgi:hypothetical protein
MAQSSVRGWDLGLDHKCTRDGVIGNLATPQREPMVDWMVWGRNADNSHTHSCPA